MCVWRYDPRPTSPCSTHIGLAAGYLLPHPTTQPFAETTPSSWKLHTIFCCYCLVDANHTAPTIIYSLADVFVFAPRKHQSATASVGLLSRPYDARSPAADLLRLSREGEKHLRATAATRTTTSNSETTGNLLYQLLHLPLLVSRSLVLLHLIFDHHPASALLDQRLLMFDPA
jgi:hypothetical protein